jgi:UDPglucose 6-dehydrogenase
MDIAVVGIGRVGLIASCSLADAGHKVIGIEINENSLELLNAGVAPYHESGIEKLLKRGLSSGNLKFSTALPISLKTDVVMVAVNTPSLPDGNSDLSQVYAAVAQVRDSISSPTIMVMKSTVPPGTGVKLIKDYLEVTTITYVSNPEFLRAGQGVYDWYHPSRIVIGTDEERAADKLRLMYSGVQSPMLVTDITTAEMIKYASNAFLATKVSFINEIANICEAVGANIDDVSRGMGLDPRIGPAFLQAGLGYGGSCLPKDTAALEYVASSRGYDFKLLRATIEVNTRQRRLVVDKLKHLLSSLQGKQIALLGLAFKPGTNDITEAPSLDIARLLIAEGAKLRAYDPVAIDNARSLLPDSVVFAGDIYSATAGVHAAILLTEWQEFIEADWYAIKKGMLEPCVIIDGRNALPKEKLIAAGFKYEGIGRKS